MIDNALAKANDSSQENDSNKEKNTIAAEDEDGKEDTQGNKEKGAALARSAAADVTAKNPDWATVNNVAKCNIYVNDKLTANNMNPYTYALSAADWANSKLKIPNWEIVTTPRPGDIAAFKQKRANATGHMGIVGQPTIVSNQNTLIYGGSSEYKYIVRSTIASFNHNNWIYRRYTGK